MKEEFQDVIRILPTKKLVREYNDMKTFELRATPNMKVYKINSVDKFHSGGGRGVVPGRIASAAYVALKMRICAADLSLQLN